MSQIKEEYQSAQRIKFAIVSVVFGIFGLHRFMRHQYLSGFGFLIVFGAMVFMIGNPTKLSIVVVGLVILLILAVIDAITMLSRGRFYLDEQHVKISSKSW